MSCVLYVYVSDNKPFASMSIAGRRALEGFSYQDLIALNWLVEMIDEERDDPVRRFTADSVGFLDDDAPPQVDDVVVEFESGNRLHIQAKKNQPDRRHWSFTNGTMRRELQKTRDDLESEDNLRVRFYSRDPFGDLTKLVGALRSKYPNYRIFEDTAPATLKDPLAELAKCIERTEEEAFGLARRIEFKMTEGFDPLERELRRKLRTIVSDSQAALNALASLLRRHTSGHEKTPHFEIKRQDVINVLSRAGVIVTPERSVEDIRSAFHSASQIGRSWPRTIDGERIPRKEVDEIFAHVRDGADSVVVLGKPGVGKTCVLLDLVERVEGDTELGSLFVKGDRFCDVSSLEDLEEKGMPDDIVGQCARFAGNRRLVVIIDALDVLSLKRHHDALTVFLSLIEQLASIPNVTVVAACRSFDLEYDPHLRGVEWNARVVVDLLDFDRDVVHFLERWGTDPASIPEKLRTTLRIPQNLSLYSKVAQAGDVTEIESEYQLQERFLQEVVVKDNLLGEEALEALQFMASRLVETRSHEMDRSQFGAGEPVVRRLVSQDVLCETNSLLRFNHQTLGDTLAIRQAIQQGETLLDFIRRHPPFPFLRPAVRGFFFYLRSRNPAAFRKQIWEVLKENEVAYHLRRLVAESLVEIRPTVEDWPLIRRLFTGRENLFRRFFDRTKGDDWFEFLRDNWLPHAISCGADVLLALYVRKLGIWFPTHTEEVVVLWHQAFDEAWTQPEKVADSIVDAIQQSEFIDVVDPAFEKLLQLLIETLDPNHHTFELALESILSDWVKETDQGDELIWRYLMKDGRSDESRHRDSPHDISLNGSLVRKDFLSERFETSDALISLAVEAVEEWSEMVQYPNSPTRLRTALLDSTSWMDVRSDRDIHVRADIGHLLRKLEAAFCRRASRNDQWWNANEPRFRSSDDVALRYLLIQAYAETIPDNLDGIEAQICDTDLLRCTELDHEIGCMMQKAYPYLSREVRRKNQQTILDLYRSYRKEGPIPKWRVEPLYNCLNRIPRCYLESEAAEFLSEWESEFGTIRSQPRIRSASGTVAFPIAPERLCTLSDDALFRILDDFEDVQHFHRRHSGGLVGGLDELHESLREATQLDPARFLSLRQHLRSRSLHEGGEQAILRGVAWHVLYRFGNISPGGEWSPFRPLPSGEQLTRSLLQAAETSDVLWREVNAARRVVNACSTLVPDSEYAARVVMVIYKLLNPRSFSSGQASDPPQFKQGVIENSLQDAAESAIKLWKTIHDRGIFVPELLPGLMVRCARVPNMKVKKRMLRWLPLVIQADEEFGWDLFDAAMKDAPAETWASAGRTLYVNYYSNFEHVEQRLDDLQSRALPQAGETYGRILTLAHLAGHVSEDELFQRLDAETCRVGAAQVFLANLDRQASTCISGALRLLHASGLGSATWRELSGVLNTENHKHVHQELISALLDRIPLDYEDPYFGDLGDWIAQASKSDPAVALDVAEQAIGVAEDRDIHWAFRSEPIAQALISILREADDFGEEEMAHRAITLQDRLLQLGAHHVDRLLDEASLER